MNPDYPYLSEVEIEKIKAFQEDEVMREAVKKVLLSDVYQNGVMKPGEKHNALKNAALGLMYGPTGHQKELSNEELGARLRSYNEGIQNVEKGFNKIEAIGNPPAQDNKPGRNKAR